MLTLHLEATNYEDLRRQVSEMFPTNKPAAPIETMTAETAAPAHAPAPDPVVEVPVDAPVVKRPPGRPKKETVAEAPAPVAAAPLTLDTVRAALQAFATSQADQTVGIVKVREVLATFKDAKGESCQKISQIQSDDYAALLKKVAC